MSGSNHGSMKEWPSTEPKLVSDFRPDIEGLRAVAVLLVLLYHARFGFTGGFVGVDVFFVVSGFLITSMLISEGISGSVSLPNFWARRARRLLPASALAVVATLIASWFMLEPTRLAGLAGDALATATFSVNIRFAVLGSGYLSGLSLPSPLLHFWSLALEEQFYLLWPIVVALAAKFRQFKRILGSLIVVLFTGSLAASYLYTSEYPTAAFYLLPTRAWELLAGAGLALATPQLARLQVPLRALLGWIGLFSVLLVGWFFNENTVFPGVLALAPVVATSAMVISGCGTVCGPGRLLAITPLQWIGRRSYSLYLWHWPLLILLEARFGILGTLPRAGVLVLSTILAAISFAFVEEPGRRHVWLAELPRRSILAGVALAGIVLVAGISLSVLSPSTAMKPLTIEPSVASAGSQKLQELQISPNTTAPPPVALGRVLLIGDSTLTALRQFENGSISLKGFDWTLDAESCRRIVLRSCQRDGRRPKSVVTVIDGLTAKNKHYDTILVMAGYHSTPESIGKEFEDLVSSARTHGAKRLVFMTLRETLAFPAAGSRGKLSVYSGFNETIRARLSTVPSPEVILLDWNGFAAPEWFRSDGMHTNLIGTLGLGEYLSDSFAAMEGRPCPRDIALTPCQVPTSADSSVDLLARYGVTDTD